MRGERERERERERRGGVTGRETRAVEKKRVGYVIKLCFVEKEMGMVMDTKSERKQEMQNRRERGGDREGESNVENKN
jgi:hypothetical protein